MKRLLLALVVIVPMLCFSKNSDSEWVKNAVRVASQQMLQTSRSIEDPTKTPRSVISAPSTKFLTKQLGYNPEGKIDSMVQAKQSSVGNIHYCANVFDWTSGFFPGTLWYIYDITSGAKIKNEAIRFTDAMYPVRNVTRTHDIGFMVNCSFGNYLRLAPNDSVRIVVIEAADNLIGRFDEKIGCIRSWDFGDWNYPVIIDNMMNLDLLFLASNLTGDSRYRDIAVKHAKTTMKNHFRADNSSYHVVSYNSDGSVEEKCTHQGKNDDSSWARGQAWGLYGYVSCYKATNDKVFLTQALKIYDLTRERVKTKDNIPYWDYDAPVGKDTPRDASAAAITASACLELSTLVDNGDEYLAYAESILKSLSSPAYLTKVGENSGFILKHSTGSLPHASEVDVPINYADYYYMEALSRYINIKELALRPYKVAEDVNLKAFELLNLDYKGLEGVKKHYQAKEYDLAAAALLDYYRARTNINHPDVDLNNIKPSKLDWTKANQALNNQLYGHKGYQPSAFYGRDIDWQFWPVKDNELRWQLHRHTWFSSLGKAYNVTKNSKYSRAWVEQYLDWIEKNPYHKIEKQKYEMLDRATGKDENIRFAWRPLEVSHRIEDQTDQFALFIAAEEFTPKFLTHFLVNYNASADVVLNNYSAKGNHLLFEAQRMIYAGVYFPEFKAAPAWRKSGIGVLNKEVSVQVYDDGVQYELDPGYHNGCIMIFAKGLRMAAINGFAGEFPKLYLDTIEYMIEFTTNMTYPDYSNTCFSDAKQGSPSSLQGNYREWSDIFPDNEVLKYMATRGKEGKMPNNLSKGYKTGGFFIFRNSWEVDDSATMMVVKAGPKAAWHCQPDNGTFELWFNGKNLFPDSGAYIYAGNEEIMALRNWFRQTRVHNTITLDDKTIEVTESVTKLWETEGDVQTLVTQNPSYKGLDHRRTVFFVDESYFVIVDQAMGDAKGVVNLNYNFAVGEVAIDKAQNLVKSNYKGDSNFILECFSNSEMSLNEQDGWCSTSYRKRDKRTALSFDVDKKSDNSSVNFITVIRPSKNVTKLSPCEAKLIKADDSGVVVEVVIDGVTKTLSSKI